MAIGVDIGGSGVRAAHVTAGRIAEPVVRVPLHGRSIDEVVDAVEQAVQAVGGGDVGIGVPGFVRDGVVLGSPNFPGWERVDLASALTHRLGRRVRVENDANVAALGAWAHRGSREDLVMLTLGTGVGGGVVIGGRLLTGAGGTGAELGHIHVGGSRTCGCGGIGCLETWVGTVGLVAASGAVGHPVSNGEAIVRAADDGEAWARDVLQRAAEYLGRGLVTLVNVFNPDVVVIAGGLTAARPHLGAAEDWLRRFGVPPSVEHVRIVWEGRAEDHAIVGAATLVGAPPSA